MFKYKEKQQLLTVHTPCLNKKHATYIFLNNSMRHRPIMIIFGIQHHE